MKIARYEGGAVQILDAPEPELPEGGLIVQTEACGLCSGELMGWYMEQKAKPVLGHEVAGRVIASDTKLFPIGARVFPHHHAPCGQCPLCLSGAFVQCDTWRRTRLEPGGMAERFSVGSENLSDTHIVNDLRAIDAALIEPLACVAKSLRRSGWKPNSAAAVIGLGNMGLLHMLALGERAVGYDLNEVRVSHARGLGLAIGSPGAEGEFKCVFVCPGSASALEAGIRLAAPGGAVLLFAPFGSAPIPGEIIDKAYFNDLSLITSYSAGPDDTGEALKWLRSGVVKAEQVVSDFISLDQLPDHYKRMRDGEIVKAMVLFGKSD